LSDAGTNVLSVRNSPPTGSVSQVAASCPAGTKIVGGGFHFVGVHPLNPIAGTAPPLVLGSYVDTAFGIQSWIVEFLAAGNSLTDMDIYAYCI
jgi:hypothetical protein